MHADLSDVTQIANESQRSDFGPLRISCVESRDLTFYLGGQTSVTASATNLCPASV